MTDTTIDTIERGDIVYSGKLPANGVVVHVYQTYALVIYGPNYEREDGVYARRATVHLEDLQVVRKREA